MLLVLSREERFGRKREIHISVVVVEKKMRCLGFYSISIKRVTKGVLEKVCL